MATASDFLLERLQTWGIRRIFGYSGDGINGIIGAIARTKGAIEFVQVRHEEQAAFMACAHAKFTGEIGVCLATSGPGAIHLLNGLYDAKGDHTPVLAIVGQSSTMALGGDYQQEVDLNVLFKDVASDYVVSVVNPVQVRHAVDRAVRTALARRSVTAIIIPKDVQEMKAVTQSPHIHNTIHSSAGFEPGRAVPAREALVRAAEILNAGSKVAMLVGQGAKDAQTELVTVADRLGAGCAKALLGKAVLPDTYPWVTGTIGLLGTQPSSDMMLECDTLLMIGTSFPYAEFLPKEGKVRAIQIDADGKNLGLRYPTELNLEGDARATLQALLPFLEQKNDSSWRDVLAEKRKKFDAVSAARAENEGAQLNPEVVFTELSPRLPDRCVLSGDAGTATNWLARHLVMREGMKFSLSGSLATMGPAVPYAIAAKFAFPDRVAIAMTGDGAMQMGGLAEMITVVRYWKTWADPRLIVVVLNNRDLNQVSWEMRIESGDPKFEASQELPDFPYARYAEMLGFRGIRVEHANEVGAAWDAALASDRPVIFEAVTDPSISLLPPHISFEQAKHLSTALIKGDPDERDVIVESAKSVLSGIFPGAHKG